MNDIATPQLAFRVAATAGALAVLAYLGPDFHLVAGVVLVIAGGVMLFYGIRDRKRPVAKRRRDILNAGLTLAAGGVLLSGIVAFLATPLLVLAGVCGALGVIALLGSTGDSYSS